MPYTDPDEYREYQRQYREQNRERLAEYDRERKKAANLTSEEKLEKRARWRAWYAQNQDRMRPITNTRVRKSNAKLRFEVLLAYSSGDPQCACCGENALEFLALDHINGGGAEHRRQIGSRNSVTMFRWARDNGYPPLFQVLCHNCNLAKGFYGQCPHQRDTTQET
jgi:hypothetical protein